MIYEPGHRCERHHLEAVHWPCTGKQPASCTLSSTTLPASLLLLTLTPCCPCCCPQAKNILIAVGGTPQKLNIPGADLCITSDEALELPAAPQKITVLGGGYIALEFSGIFRRLGAEVHTVYRQPKPLRGFDEEVRWCGGSLCKCRWCLWCCWLCCAGQCLLGMS